MCYCNNVEVGTYENQVKLKVPENIVIRANSPEGERKYTIYVDRCLEREILWLWSKGVVTSGCCCGHNKQLPYIGVEESSIKKMKELGYVVQTNPCGMENLFREDSFYSKILPLIPEMFESHIRHLVGNFIRRWQT